MTGAEKDTLIALVEAGPLWDGDVPSKAGRDALIASGLAARVIVRGEDGWQAATYAGHDQGSQDQLADAPRDPKRFACRVRPNAQA